MRTLDELETFLSQFLNFEKLPQKNIFWLDTMEFLCARFGSPQDAQGAIHAAGSKGKGSVSAMMQAVIAGMGLKCGLYASPHVTSFSERINLGKHLFTENEYQAAFTELKNGLDRIPPEDLPAGRPVTWFELVTLYAFLVFKHARCGWAVFETGLGGRLDATNVLKPRMCVITAIEKEHTEYLGNTLEEIAGEKAGIIKENTPVIAAGQTPEVKKVLERAARAKNAPFIYLPDVCEARTSGTDSAPGAGERVKISSPLFARPIETTLAMRGKFQAHNAALAAVALKTIFPALGEDVIEAGLAQVALPARFEMIEHPARYPKIPFLVIDGAHTQKSIAHTVETFSRLFDEMNADLLGRAQLIFSCAQDKDVEAIAKTLRGFSDVTLTLPGTIKKADPERMRRAFDREGIPNVFKADFEEAIRESFERANERGNPVLITGSFYLAAEAKKALPSAGPEPDS